MGASGAGKTSLLNVIADRIEKKKGIKLDGEVLLNDKHRLTSEIFGQYATYIM